MTRKMGGKKGHVKGRAPWIAGLVVAGVAVAAGAVLLTSKKANAQPTVQLSPLQQAAVDMNSAIDAHGYVQADQQVYRDFQSAAGLKNDGWPGQGTYKALTAALASIVPPVPPSSRLNAAYTFKNPPGWDGVSAPLPQDWFGTTTVPQGGWPAAGS